MSYFRSGFMVATIAEMKSLTADLEQNPLVDGTLEILSIDPTAARP